MAENAGCRLSPLNDGKGRLAFIERLTKRGAALRRMEKSFYSDACVCYGGCFQAFSALLLTRSDKALATVATVVVSTKNPGAAVDFCKKRNKIKHMN